MKPDILQKAKAIDKRIADLKQDKIVWEKSGLIEIKLSAGVPLYKNIPFGEIKDLVIKNIASKIKAAEKELKKL